MPTTRKTPAIAAAGAALLLYVCLARAQEPFDESALFSDSSSVVDSASIVNTEAASALLAEKRGVGLSGEVFAYAVPSLSRAWFDDPSADSIGFGSQLVGNALLDIRLVGGAKAFADFEAAYSPNSGKAVTADTMGLFATDTASTTFLLREMFVDANWRKLVYLRAGKQVLQWGRCNFWNPTDLVNVERKSFLQKMGHREGTYGLKLHIPYKTLFNFYSFIDANGATTAARDLAVSAKAEALVGRTEVAVSGWKRDGKQPMFGVDLSTQLFEVQIAAEASLRNGRDMITLEKENGDWKASTIGDAWIPRVSVGLTKFLSLNGVADRVMVSGEFYYNHAGYDVNVFNDSTLKPALPLLMSGTPLPKIVGMLLNAPAWQSDPAIVSNLYEMHSYSKYYAAFFTSISRFILDDMTFSCNAIGNLNQKCIIVSTGLDYQSLHNFVFGVSLNAFLGPKDTEYTVSNGGLMAQVRAGVVF